MENEEVSIEEIIEQNYNHLFNLYLRKTSNDDVADHVVTMAFLKLKEKWDQLESHTAPGLRAWLYQATDFAFRDHCKKQKRRPETVNLDAYLLTHPDFCPESDDGDPMEEILEAEAYHKMLERIKEILPAKQYILFERMLEHDFDVQATAQAYNLNPGTVRVYWSRIRHRLQVLKQRK